MKSIEDYILQKQAVFSGHDFFTALDKATNFELAIQGFGPVVAFFVCSVQDMMRINHESISDPRLRDVAGAHRVEDAGHDKMFLRDLEQLRGSGVDIDWLFNDELAPVRDASYRMMADILALEDDFLRVIFLLALESTGHVFFAHVSRQAEASRYARKLHYFAGRHLDLEKGHSMFIRERQRSLYEHVLSPEARARAYTLIDRLYVNVESIMNALTPHVIAADDHPSDAIAMVS